MRRRTNLFCGRNAILLAFDGVILFLKKKKKHFILHVKHFLSVFKAVTNTFDNYKAGFGGFVRIPKRRTFKGRRSIVARGDRETAVAREVSLAARAHMTARVQWSRDLARKPVL